MLVNSISSNGNSSSRYCKRCVVDVDGLKLHGLAVSVSYEEDLKNPETWITVCSERHTLKIIVNENVASRGKASLNREPPDSAMGGDGFDKMMSEFFKLNNHPKYFAVDTPTKLFAEAISLFPPVNVSDLHKT